MSEPVGEEILTEECVCCGHPLYLHSFGGCATGCARCWCRKFWWPTKPRLSEPIIRSVVA